MTLTQLRYLVAIADSGLNITVAAERVHATQPGLSKQLKLLEDELGFQLFSRKGRSLEAITPSGAQVIARARLALNETNNIRALAANLRQESAGELILSTTHTQARYVLPAAIGNLKRAYPDVSVHLQPSAEGEVLDLLSQGKTDLALVSSSGHAPSGGLAVPVYRWRRVLLVPKDHGFARLGRAPTLAELATVPLVSYESSLKPESSLRQSFARAGQTPHFAFTARDADLIKTYVRAGLGVGILAEMAMLPEDSGDLQVLPAADDFAECIAWAVLPRERVPRDYTLALVTTLAPQLDRRDLRRALEGTFNEPWPIAPSWQELSAPAEGR
jgi:DNA-binding transcriptional LysR family regulator